MERDVHVRYVSDEFINSSYVKDFKFELCEDIIWFLTFFSFLAIISYKYTGSMSIVYGEISVIIPIALMSFFRVKLNRFISIIISNIAITILSIIIFQAIFKRVEICLFILPWTLRSILKGQRDQRPQISIGNILINELIIAVELFTSLYAGSEGFASYILAIAIIMGIFSLIYIYRFRTFRFFIKDKIDNRVVEVSNEYSRKSFTWITIIIIAIISATLYFSGIFAVANKASKGIVSYTSKIEGIKGEIENNTKQEDTTTSNIPQELVGSSKPSTFMQIISVILSVIIQIVFFIVAICVAIFVCVMLYRSLNYYLIKLRGKKNGDKVEYIYKKREKKQEKEKIKNRLFFRRDKDINNEEQIRRIYKKKVLSYKKKIALNNTFTTREIERCIEEKGNYDISDLTNIYEKARYSSYKVSNDEVNKFK